VVQVSFVAVGLVITGEAILTPMLMVLMMVTGDLLAMSSATDRVRPSPSPSVWNIASLSKAAIGLGIVDLGFCVGCLWTAHYVFGLSNASLRTVTVVTLVFSGQALFYVARERRHLWSSRPSVWVMASSLIDILVVVTLSALGFLMVPLSPMIIAALAGAAVLLAFVLDAIKLVLFARLRIA
jgi:H+-transporting ATPase